MGDRCLGDPDHLEYELFRFNWCLIQCTVGAHAHWDEMRCIERFVTVAVLVVRNALANF
ncbi:MAG: hypothetical protein RLZZ621_946 [Gemmatimonadota bacterium]